MRKSLYDHCAECGDDLLLRQWHTARNEKLTPKDVAKYSHKKIWWQCDRGHEWQSRVSSRTSDGTGCPICKNRKALSGENDLATMWPELAKEWHPVKNGELVPEQVTPGTRRKVWWQCSQGHEWQASLIARTLNGTGCPFCAGKTVIQGQNDLLSVYPEQAAQWHPVRNGNLMPSQFSAYSSRRVWWQCSQGHEWQAAISSRTCRYTGCPYCTGRKVLAGFNDLATTAPDVAEQWNPELNGTLTPEQVTASSHKKVWWKCPTGHVWKACIHSRAGSGRRCGCPVCAGKVNLAREARYAAAMAEHTINNGIRRG